MQVCLFSCPSLLVYSLLVIVGEVGSCSRIRPCCFKGRLVCSKLKHGVGLQVSMLKILLLALPLFPA
jgi:hypothetical protein